MPYLEGMSRFQDPISFLIVSSTGVHHQAFYVAYKFGSEPPSKQAFDSVNRRTRNEDVSCFRMNIYGTSDWIVVGLGETIEAVSAVSRTLAEAGDPTVLPDDYLLRLQLRRARALVESGGEQQGHYGKPGMELDGKGRLRPFRRRSSE